MKGTDGAIQPPPLPALTENNIKYETTLVKFKLMCVGHPIYEFIPSTTAL